MVTKKFLAITILRPLKPETVHQKKANTFETKKSKPFKYTCSFSFSVFVCECLSSLRFWVRKALATTSPNTFPRTNSRCETEPPHALSHQAPPFLDTNRPHAKPPDTKPQTRKTAPPIFAKRPGTIRKRKLTTRARPRHERPSEASSDPLVGDRPLLLLFVCPRQQVHRVQCLSYPNNHRYFVIFWIGKTRS